MDRLVGFVVAMTEGVARMAIDMVVNGIPRHLEISVSELLIDVLRERLHLTGTKLSCDLQMCGTCTVLVDGAAINSCTTLAVECDGHSVETVEGMAKADTLHPLQEAFVEHFALQCGFCTPGFLMTAQALLEELPEATEEETVRYLDGNVCRCGCYGNILKAISSVATDPRPVRGP